MRLIRLRGDVKLTATLNESGADSQGTVTGSMNNFEFLRRGIWSTDVNFRMLLDDGDDVAVELRIGRHQGRRLLQRRCGRDGQRGGRAVAPIISDDGTYGGALLWPSSPRHARGSRRMESADEQGGGQSESGKGRHHRQLRRQERAGAVGVRRACRSRTRRVPPGARRFSPGRLPGPLILHRRLSVPACAPGSSRSASRRWVKSILREVRQGTGFRAGGRCGRSGRPWFGVGSGGCNAGRRRRDSGRVRARDRVPANMLRSRTPCGTPRPSGPPPPSTAVAGGGAGGLWSPV